MLVQGYCKKNNFNESKYRDLTRDPDNCPDDFPKWPGLCGRRLVDLDEIEKEAEEVQKQIKSFESKATVDLSKDADDNAMFARESSFTGVCFVIMNKPVDCLKVLESQDSFFYGKLKRFLGCFVCMDNSSYWWFERAPEPTDIFWENLDVSTCTRVVASLFSYAATAFMIVMCLGIITAIKQAKTSAIADMKKSGKIVEF